MFFKLIKSASGIVFCLLFNSCSTGLKVPTVNDAQISGVKLETLIQGRDLYLNKCGSCHYLYLPEKFTSQEWSKIVQIMKTPARINDEETEKIIKYLVSNSKTGF